jgi:hypothetical protein
VPPEKFGFDVTKFNNADIATALCGNAGYSTINLQHTYMIHLVRKINGGVEFRSRFWLGYDTKFNYFSAKSFVNRVVNSKFVKSIVMRENIAQSMAYHCAREYHNLAEILPDLYKQYSSD